MESFLVLILMFGARYYLLLRPQQKREKARRELVRSLQPGDEVITNAGIHGVVAEVEDAVVWLEVAPNVELKISRDSVAGKTASVDTDDSDDAESDDAESDDAESADAEEVVETKQEGS